MATPAGMKRFARTITTRRDGKCEYCEAATRTGVDYAGVNGEGKWTGVCAVCASSITEQCKGVTRTIAALGDVECPGVDTVDLTGIGAVLAGQATEAAAYDMLLNLMIVRHLMREAIKAQAIASAPANPLIDGLRAIATSPTAQPRDRDFAASLVAWVDRGRDLTFKQQAAAERMVARLAPASAPVVAVENGLYLNTVTERIYKLYNTQNDRQGCKVLEVYASHGSFHYLPGGTKRVAEMVAAGEARKLTEAEAQAFGKLHGFCVNCTKDLDDERSLAVGYGPTCAKRFGWFYPDYYQAATMLGRPFTASNGKTYEPDTAPFTVVGGFTFDPAQDTAPPVPPTTGWICDKGSSHPQDQTSCECGDI